MAFLSVGTSLGVAELGLVVVGKLSDVIDMDKHEVLVNAYRMLEIQLPSC